MLDRLAFPPILSSLACLPHTETAEDRAFIDDRAVEDDGPSWSGRAVVVSKGGAVLSDGMLPDGMLL